MRLPTRSEREGENRRACYSSGRKVGFQRLERTDATRVAWINHLIEIGEGGGIGFEGGDGFDEAGDGEGVADAAGAADEVESAVFAGEAGGDAGAVDLGDAVEIDDYFSETFLNDGLQGFVELVAGFADGEAAVDFEHGDAAGVADVDFHWCTVGHLESSRTPRAPALHGSGQIPTDAK